MNLIVSRHHFTTWLATVLIICKQNQLCSHCLSSVRCTDLSTANDVISITNLKEYKEGSLTRVSRTVFDEVLVQRDVFREFKPKLLSTKSILKHLIAYCTAYGNTLDTPTCHNLQSRLMTKFLTVTLRFFCRKLCTSALGSKCCHKSFSQECKVGCLLHLYLYTSPDLNIAMCI